MSDLEVALGGKSLADYTKTKLMTALGAPTYTSVGDMWYKYLSSLGYTGSFTDMLQKFYVANSVPYWARNPYNASAYISTSDPSFASVSALLHFDGVNGSTTYTDQKGNVWTGFNSVQISTANSKFGGASALFNTGRISAPDSDAFNFGSGDFTVECWFYETASGASRQIVGQHTTTAAGVAGSSFLLLSDSAKLTFQIFVGTTVYTAANPSTHALNAWHHAAAVRIGNTIKTFLNGVEVASTAVAGTVNNSAEPFVLGVVMADGGPDPSNLYFIGNIDDLRVTKGVARYSGNFATPPSAFPNS